MEACSQPEGKGHETAGEKMLQCDAADITEKKHFSTSVVRFIIAISRRPSRHQCCDAGLLDGTGDVAPGSGSFRVENIRVKETESARQRCAVGMGPLSSHHCFHLSCLLFAISSELPSH